MDKRTRDIMEDFEKRKIGVDEPFKFRCTMCGKCCIHREDILINPRDVFNMAKELKISIRELLQQYCEIFIGPDSRVPLIRLMPRGNVQRCPLLKDRKCMVHNAKPTICALYPLGRGVKYDKAAEKENTEEENAGITEDDIQYFFTDPDCGARDETHTVREWLDSFGLSVADEFVIRWQAVMYKLSSLMRKIEQIVDVEVMKLFWSAALDNMYLEYDLTQEFLPQFDGNVAKLFLTIYKIVDDLEKED